MLRRHDLTRTQPAAQVPVRRCPSMLLFVVTLGSSISPTFALPEDSRATRAPERILGQPPRKPDGPALTPSRKARRIAGGGAGGFGALDLTDRQLSRGFYNSIFDAHESVAIDWTGDTDRCRAGTTSDAFKDGVLTRINFFRAMAGVPDRVAFDDGFSAKAQEAALMMSANEALSHQPPRSWDCFTQAGFDGAGNSNLSLGDNGWDGIWGYMQDWGERNAPLGHRRWLLYPQTRSMGTGDVPQDGGFFPANAIWVFDDHIWAQRPAVRDDFVAWPPPGFVPYPIVFPRWSFAYPDADFEAATVTMTKNGRSVAVELERLETGFGENTIVWIAEGLDPNDPFALWPRPSTDTTYTIRVSNVVVNRSRRNFTYQVTVFDPSVAHQQEVLPLVSGNTSVTIGIPETYRFAKLSWSRDYELRRWESLVAHSGIEGAERGLDGIVDGTDSSYPLITNQSRASGSFSFHLAHPRPARQYFALAQDFYIDRGATLVFQSRLGTATPGQVGKAQVSLNGGSSWIDLFSQAGVGNGGERRFNRHSVSLAPYVGRTARFRFVYEYAGGSYFPQVSASVGFFVDDIQLTNVRVGTDRTLTALDDPGPFEFTAPRPGTHGLQVRAVPWQGFSGLDWGPLLLVEAPALPRFRRGNCDGDESTSLTDAVFLLVHLFQGGDAPDCAKACDVNDDGDTSLTDAVILLIHLFQAGVAPLAPYGSCGEDPSMDALRCETQVGCAG